MVENNTKWPVFDRAVENGIQIFSAGIGLLVLGMIESAIGVTGLKVVPTVVSLSGMALIVVGAMFARRNKTRALRIAYLLAMIGGSGQFVGIVLHETTHYLHGSHSGHHLHGSHGGALGSLNTLSHYAASIGFLTFIVATLVIVVGTVIVRVRSADGPS